jgi:hypothetical protein
MPNNTWVALDSQTVSGSTTAQVVFSSISQAYTDLVIIKNGSGTGGSNTGVRFNADSGAHYYDSYVVGDGSTTGSGADVGGTFVTFDYIPTTGDRTMTRVDILNYANPNMYKTFIARRADVVNAVVLITGLWKSSTGSDITEAISSVTILNTTGTYISSGTTFTLYGIKKETNVGTKATGGVIYTDATYAYHVFTSSGTFTPSTSLSADVLIVAGGGSGGGAYTGGGGGAGGLRAFTSQSLTSGTGYTCTVGAGAKGGLYAVNPNGSKGLQGSNTTFSSLSVTGGGGGASWGTNPSSGGGSGGGGGPEYASAGAGNAGGYTPVEGYAGGNGVVTSVYAAGGGGGAGGAAANSTAGIGTAGGVGTNTYNSINFSSWLTATGLGTGGKLAGGGGAGGQGNPASAPTYDAANGTDGGGNGSATLSGGAGAVATGSGGGGAGYPYNGSQGVGGNGGSGLIIIRYVKLGELNG